MDKKILYDALTDMEKTLSETLRNVSEIKATTQEVIERNNTLEMENTRLRDRIAQLSKNEKKTKVKNRAQIAMEKLYNDGFHICNLSYGQRRENDEECMLCLDMLDTLD
ncbi:Regulator of replication initiation timing [Pilibacter termitis]|uniref:Regulator of replication initiation timing n=1 Tax=Pilibacter termitis TaxID=263852 RepID=A0A1T4PBI4_9ENTE|nr:DNA replication initiation control protein YabA [Pilibacter termitis]SJZ88829.1 Regulator of replication initiation timing [Pilibacter termitis]